MKKLFSLVLVSCALLGSQENLVSNETRQFCACRLTFPFSTLNLYHFFKQQSNQASSTATYRLEKNNERYVLEIEDSNNGQGIQIGKAIAFTQKNDPKQELTLDPSAKCKKESNKITCTCSISHFLYQAVKEQYESDSRANNRSK